MAFKLTKKDKEYLIECGYSTDDFQQIEEFGQNRDMRYYRSFNHTDEGEIRISRVKAIELVGREQFISGLARATFHSTAYRPLNDNEGVSFNARIIWKKIINS